MKLTRDPYSIVAKGALGCFLSHVRAWEKIKFGRSPLALVLEDDARLTAPEILLGIEFPPELELIFCNDRTQPHDFIKEGSASVIPTFSPLELSLSAIDRRARAVGTDGYLITQSGAGRLIEALRSDLYFSHVDLRLLQYSTDPALVEAHLDADSRTRKVLQQISSACPSGMRLSASVLTPNILSHNAGTVTTRTREDQLGLSGADPANRST